MRTYNSILKGLQEAIDCDRENITTKDFKEKYCNDCYWHKWNKCDIEKAKLKNCCNSLVEIGRYKLV
jgi:hypothetical protein